MRNYNKGEKNPKEWRESRDERREDLEFFARRSASISHINRGQVDAIALLSQSMDFTDAGIDNSLQREATVGEKKTSHTDSEFYRI